MVELDGGCDCSGCDLNELVVAGEHRHSDLVVIWLDVYHVGEGGCGLVEIVESY